MISYTNLELIILITIIFNAFFEGVIMFVFDSDIYNFSKLDSNTMKLINMYYDLVNVLLVVITLYLLFIKKARTVVAIVLCILILFKGFMHLIVSRSIYKYFNLSYENEQKLLVFHDHFALYASIVNICLTTFLLRNIFFM
jgi:hypothetical protein